LSNREIAERLDRTEAGIRNIRHRLQLSAETKNSIQTLIEEKEKLEKEIKSLQQKRTNQSYEIKNLNERKENLNKAIELDEKTLNDRLVKSLTQLKFYQPELFRISGQEFLTNTAGHIITNLVKYLLK
jgi:predicted  nucleic acid-binding Zn-ribbon protein